MELFLLHSFLFLLLLPLLVYLWNAQNQAKRPSHSGITRHPFLGHLPELYKNRHRFLDWLAETVAATPNHTVVLHMPGRVPRVITANPSNVEHMLKTKFANYPKGELSISVVEDFLGHGIFSSDGEQWKWQRKATSLEFNKRQFRGLVVDAVRQEISRRLLPMLKKAADDRNVIDLQDILERFAFDTISMVSFNEDPSQLPDESAKDMSSDFMRAFREAQDLVMGRFESTVQALWWIKKLLNIGSEKQLKNSISVIHNYALGFVRSRSAQTLDQTDGNLLSRYVAEGDCNTEFLCKVVTNFLLGGSATISSALTWFFWLVSGRQDVRDKIREEIGALREAKGCTEMEMFCYDEIREMHYLHAALTESMRLHPPVPVDLQSCKADDTMPDGTFVGAGWTVGYSAYAMARLEEVWGKDCCKYRPERWLQEGVFQPESPFRYPVFHAGPRVCLGKEMAYIQMKFVAACVFERFGIKFAGKDSTAEPFLSMTMRMKGGLPVEVSTIEEELM